MRVLLFDTLYYYSGQQNVFYNNIPIIRGRSIKRQTKKFNSFKCSLIDDCQIKIII